MVNKKLKIVVVDDEPIIRMDIIYMLESAGYDVVGQGSDGFEAVELCKKYKPDVILLDIKMEQLDGLSAAKVISEEYPQTAIVMLTAFSKGEYIDKAKESNISSYLLKPINEKMLIPNIELAVARNLEKNKYKRDADKVNVRLAERKLIERAKGLLMERRDITEDEAYGYIRTISKNRNLSMAKVAEIIVGKYSEHK